MKYRSLFENLRQQRVHDVATLRAPASARLVLRAWCDPVLSEDIDSVVHEVFAAARSGRCSEKQVRVLYEVCAEVVVRMSPLSWRRLPVQVIGALARRPGPLPPPPLMTGPMRGSVTHPERYLDQVLLVVLDDPTYPAGQDGVLGVWERNADLEDGYGVLIAHDALMLLLGQPGCPPRVYEWALRGGQTGKPDREVLDAMCDRAGVPEEFQVQAALLCAAGLQRFPQ